MIEGLSVAAPPASGVPNMQQLKYASIAAYPGHLFQQIRRCLIVGGISSTRELAEWAYRYFAQSNTHAKRWMLWNVRRCCRQWNIRVVGKRGRNLLWALPE